MRKTSIKLSTFALVCLVGLSACDNPNPAEDAGKKIDQAVDDVGTMIEESSAEAGIKVDDAAITTKVKAAFMAESMVDSLDISVDTIDGIVTLTGTTNSLESSKKAEEIALVVSEVSQVINQIVIK
jgi:hyperosmotically inducible protein